MPTAHPSLTERAMLVSLHITAWQASRYDGRISAEVAEQYGADMDAGRYNKALLPKTCAVWRGLKGAHSAARATHRELTLPWSENGSRVLPVQGYEAYVEAMGRHQAVVREAVDLFLTEYPSLRQAAPERLGDLFRGEDWPDASDLRCKFSFGWDIMPLPSAGDFRVDLAREEADAVRATIERSVQATTAQAMADVWRRVYDATEHMTSRLRGDGVCNCTACGGRAVGSDRLNESAIENLRSLCVLLPRLNMTGDERLSDATSRLHDMLAGISVEDLRASRELRERLAETAREETARVVEEAPEAAVPTVRRRIRLMAPQASAMTPAAPAVAPKVPTPEEVYADAPF